MKSEYLLLLSEILDKMEIAEELKTMEVNTGDEKKDREELGKQLIALLMTKLYKCKKEVYSFVAMYKGYLKSEEDYDTEEEYKAALKEAIKKAKSENIFDIFKEISKLDGVKDFLSIA